MTRTELTLIFGGGVLLALWWTLSRTREMVDALARQVCAELGVQRLDGTVVLREVGLRWRAPGIGLRRIYRFEFSVSGDDRRQGDVGLVNARPCWVHLEHPDGPLHIDLNRP